MPLIWPSTTLSDVYRLQQGNRRSAEPACIWRPAGLEVIDRTAPPPGQPFHPFQAGGSKDVPAFLPIGGRTLVRQTSSTHGPDGYITTDPVEITRMLARMQAKVNAAADRLALYEHFPADGADTLIITYGVTAGLLPAAVRIQRREKPTSLLVLKALWPVPGRPSAGRLRTPAASCGGDEPGAVRARDRADPAGTTVGFCGQMDGRLIAPETITEAVIHG
jgi:2-oxoglutarate ferredoxin oxidoreductase subunit alpha